MFFSLCKLIKNYKQGFTRCVDVRHFNGFCKKGIKMEKVERDSYPVGEGEWVSFLCDRCWLARPGCRKEVTREGMLVGM